jgi:hypothetical protein
MGGSCGEPDSDKLPGKRLWLNSARLHNSSHRPGACEEKNAFNFLLKAIVLYNHLM